MNAPSPAPPSTDAFNQLSKHMDNDVWVAQQDFLFSLLGRSWWRWVEDIDRWSRAGDWRQIGQVPPYGWVTTVNPDGTSSYFLGPYGWSNG